MKKLFTLVALLTLFMGAKAEWVEDYKIDYSQNTGFPFYVMGYVPEWVDGVMTDFGAMYKYVQTFTTNENGEQIPAEETSDVIVKTQNGVDYYKIELAEPGWHQYFIADGIPTELDGAYTVKAMVKASEACNINVNMGWGWDQGQQVAASVAIPAEWTEVEWEYSGIGGASCNLVAQPGTVTATIEWKYLTVSHNQKEVRPVEWLENLTSDGTPEGAYMGDAETPWDDPDVKFNDQEKNYLICAWGKEKGRNMNEDGGWDPFPCDIEEEAGVEGNHIFVVHGQPATTEGEASAWDNQFWIQSPKEWKSGTQLKIKFRYKASKNVTVATQCHKQNPSDYLIWHAIGDISFTEEWQEFDGTMTIADDMGGTWSIAFQLNQNDKDAINFYFDDLSWQNMKLDEGYFVAGANPNDGLEYDFDNAVQFVYDENEGLYTATIGEKNAYVSQIMISTVRGNDAAFKGATLKPNRAITNDPEDWIDYTESSLAKLNLPGSGIWKIYLSEEYKMMAFEMLEGTTIEPIEINPNPTLVVVNALERDDLSDQTNQQTGEVTIREDVGGTGEAWDNQFWIRANRTLSAGEVTVLQFKYKASVYARTSTQCHAEPGNYMHWAAIGDVNFTDEWQEFNEKFTVPSEANGMQSIAFNMAEIKEACDYELKDFVWKLEDNTESLINQEGADNFFVKVVGGNVYSLGIDNAVNVNTAPTVIYNLAGQRVSKDYKGIVIKNGKKYFVK
ncbi:MAG: hypothetical protein J5698_03080 [Bacteroidaceae bacterium]|nr:hypothetical protein [Bacteroidaceae bacterium]